MKITIEMGDEERRALALKHQRCPVCGFALQGRPECPLWMCRSLFVSLEHTISLLAKAELEGKS